ncbi:phosphoserine aminotransferase [Mesonia hippocampi]|uniref:Phosphoserine aminotransferase n=1 Tax=Mesonia hippocampi TaxID=1628250 RepID=A0A840ERL7_9FLAO|nr:3-phosphoserine/phosphohydroxythreonine transaminase [Mesonia hippocampi]MBB4119193.1 phosphoserine aminotransferase [Mesonia hippocampi]
MKKHNFSAGPCILPAEVFQQASEAVLDFNNSGLSILEISHRSKDFVAVIEEARNLALELLQLDNNKYTALFLHGGASMQFLMTPHNLLEKKAAYLNTGTWASKAIKEAKLFGEVIEVASSEDKNFNYIPKNFEIPTGIDYFHCTSNNTIYGTQLKSFPKSNAPLVCDMSSDIFSRDIDYSQFDLIYAGAQKNIGPAGTTLVIINKAILGKVSRKIPSILDYKSHIEKESMFNTPSVFAIYTSLLNLRWLKKQGGVSALAKINKHKAELLYAELDRNPLFTPYANKEDRSLMNITFNLANPELSHTFDALWQQAGINALNGHRSLGGYRASIYNALTVESVQLLTEVMQELENKA